jgi:hypothetical protein
MYGDHTIGTTNPNGQFYFTNKFRMDNFISLKILIIVNLER